jgi:hypothetical protein
LRILQCRHGKGSGAHVGLTFGDDVIFRECGLIDRSDEDNKRRKSPSKREIEVHKQYTKARAEKSASQPNASEDLFHGNP